MAMGSLIFDESRELAPAPFLFSEKTMERITEAERRGEYTLERLRKTRPEVIEEIIQLRGQWVGMLRIAKLVGVHHKTVAAVDVVYPEEIVEAQKRRISMMQSAADKLVEQIHDSPESVPWNVKALAASQLQDKVELLAGRPTDRVERQEHVNIHEEWKVYIEQVTAEAKAEAIDIDSAKVPETGLAAGKNSPITNGEDRAEQLGKTLTWKTWVGEQLSPELVEA